MREAPALPEELVPALQKKLVPASREKLVPKQAEKTTPEAAHGKERCPDATESCSHLQPLGSA